MIGGHPDKLRDPASAEKPDPRNEARVILDSGGFRRRTLQDHHAEVASLVLHEGVPENVRTQFETAKNLYLYGWFVYRFFPVAQMQAYACLELALRECFERFEGRQERKSRRGLKSLLNHAVESGILKLQAFEILRHKARSRASARATIETIRLMQLTGVDELPVVSGEVRAEDWDAEFLKDLPGSISFVRNHFAHGSTSLDDRALGPLRVVSEIINQVFARPSSSFKQ